MWQLRRQEEGLLAGVEPPALQGRHKVPCLGAGLELLPKVLDNKGVGSRGGAGEGSGDGKALLLAVDLDGPVAGLGAEDDATAGAERGALRATAGAASLLLLVGLPATTPNLAAGESGGSAAAAVLLVGDDGAVDDGARGGGRGGAQVEGGRADSLAIKGKHGESGLLGADRQQSGGSLGSELGVGSEVGMEVEVELELELELELEGRARGEEEGRGREGRRHRRHHEKEWMMSLDATRWSLVATRHTTPVTTMLSAFVLSFFLLFFFSSSFYAGGSWGLSES